MSTSVGTGLPFSSFMRAVLPDTRLSPDAASALAAGSAGAFGFLEALVIRRPFHVAAPAGNFRIARFRMCTLLPPPPSGIAREIGGAHQLAMFALSLLMTTHPDAHADLEDLLVPTRNGSR